MDHRMRLNPALVCLLLLIQIPILFSFTPGIDGPVTNQEAVEGGDTVLNCDTSTHTPGDELMLLVWYKRDTPIYSYDFRIGSEWSSESFNTSSRISTNLKTQPTQLKILDLKGDDESLYHCRVDFLITPTRNIGVNLTVIVLPSQPFFLDEIGNETVTNKIGPYHEGDTLVLRCLVIGGRPPPHISWYSGDILVDVSDGASDIPGVKENVLFLPLTREHTGTLECRASNTRLRPYISASRQVEIFFAAENVTISWIKGASALHTLQAGQPAVAKCRARGSYPTPEIYWALGLKHLPPIGQQTWDDNTRVAESLLEFTPSINDNGATLSCIATNVAMAPNRGSKADVISLNVTYSPILEIIKLGDEKSTDVVELDSLQLECEIKANPPVETIVWYFNDVRIIQSGIWATVNMTLNKLILIESFREHTGQYSCSAFNAVGETRSHHISITVLYPPECKNPGVTLVQETLHCNVKSLPSPDTFFWHVQASGSDVQQLTTGSHLLPLSQLVGHLSELLHVECEASNGIASQDKICEKSISLAQLRPPMPKQCDLAVEDGVFKIRCAPVDNATYYEVSVWKMSSSNSSLVLQHHGVMGSGHGTAMAQGGGDWLVRGDLGRLNHGDEAGAAACNRYGCSRALLLRPTETLLEAGASPWWHFLMDKDVGISLGAVVLVAAFIISSFLLRKLIRGPRRAKPVIQVLQLNDAREFLDSIDHKHHPSCSVKSCSSYSAASLDSDPPTVDRQRKPPHYFWDPGPDVTLTLSRESAV